MIEAAPTNRRVRLRALRTIVVEGVQHGRGQILQVDEATAFTLLTWGDAEVAASRMLMDSDPFAGRFLHR